MTPTGFTQYHASADAVSRQQPVLLIMHRLESQPGAIGQWLTANGVPLDIRRPRFGDPLPDTLAEHSGAIIFGGPMSANDPDDYVKQEIDWIGVPLSEGKPFLGICLGAQMLAKHLGAEVYLHPAGEVEVGYQPLFVNDEGADLGQWPSHVYHWHKEGFTLPNGAVLLANGNVFENQAMRYGRSAFGVQFHPEITLAIIHSWTTRSAARLSQPGAQNAVEQVKGHTLYGPDVRTWMSGFLQDWLLGSGADRAIMQAA